MVSNVHYRTFKKARMGRPVILALLALLALVLFLSVRYNPGLPFVGLFTAYILVGLTESLIGVARSRRDALATDADHIEAADTDDDDAEEAQNIR